MHKKKFVLFTFCRRLNAVKVLHKNVSWHAERHKRSASEVVYSVINDIW